MRDLGRHRVVKKSAQSIPDPCLSASLPLGILAFRQLGSYAQRATEDKFLLGQPPEAIIRPGLCTAKRRSGNIIDGYRYL